ncbi:unnamed protein product [Rotaria sordida]|uniref:Prolyl 4-hydroxylase alpha subunit domain-containing protein n=1 Tax=Rotaria sordida TaxID=392033 RepID=A0A819B9T7_9BILA|nr:unnamed protein product [Rotaria sordida]CAF3788930.1 unnamed protein product [Rotaria sordida]
MGTRINIEKVDVPLPNEEDSGKLAFILLNVLTQEECSDWIKLTEERGYIPALVNIGVREVLMTDVRNHDRCIIDDVDMANILFERIKSYLPEIFKNYKLVGLNERLRFLRYDPGQQFKGHMDGVYHRTDGSGEKSLITIQVYLNENYKGGETTFIHYSDPTKNFSCQPRTGMVLVFEHRLFHEGSMLKKGRKYTVRTDVMYRP